MSDRPLLNARANKALGQHFLFDPDILNRTALAAGPVKGRTVFEIGPGPGGLTAALLRQGAARVIAIEADPRFANALKDWDETRQDRLSVIEGDATKIDYAQTLAETGAAEPAMIVANLPYNVGTPLLVQWLKTGVWRGNMALMFQLEVALRVCAAPGDANYGRLAVLSQSVCATHIAFTLPPGAFKPPPKVDSAVAVLTPLPDDQKFTDIDAIETVTGAAFGQRRKMLRASLKSLSGTASPAELLEAADIDPTRRAETLDQQEFRQLAQVWRSSL